MPRKKKIKVNSPQKEKFIPQEEEVIPQEEEVIPQEEEVVVKEKAAVPMQDGMIPQQEESLKQLGKKIQEARISKNLSLESVSGHLHIAVKILEAIEDGNPDKGPAPVFLKGLVRTYCSYLGIEKTDIVGKIENLLDSSKLGKHQLKTLKPVIEIRESHPIRNIVAALVLVTGGYLLFSMYSNNIPSFLSHDNETESISTTVEVEEKLTNFEKIIVRDETVVKSHNSAKKFEQETNADTLTENIDTDTILIETDSNSEKSKSESEINTPNPKQTNTAELSNQALEKALLEPLTLEVEASEGTWISISIDGNEANDIRLSADEIYQWEAKKEYLLTIGNTNAVRILLNGREIETNRTHQLLTDWVIDKGFLP